MTVDWIRIGLKRTGKTRSGLARALGRSPSAVTDLLNGHRRLRADEIATVSEYLGIEPPRLIGGGPPRPPSAPLIGYVGAGAVAHFYADGQGPFDDVDAPLELEADDGGGADPRPFAWACCSTTGWSSMTISTIRRTTVSLGACASAGSATGGC